MSEVGRSPGWDRDKAIDLFYIKGRLGWKGLKASEFRDEGPILITGTDFSSGKVDWSRSVHISNERFIESPEIVVQPGDILITKDGTIGKVAFIDQIPHPGRASLNGHLFLVRSHSKKVDARFAFYVFESALFGRFVSLKQTGSTRIALPQRVFEQFDFPIPPRDAQERIADVLWTLDDAISQTTALVAKYQYIKAGLMHDLFTRGVTYDGRLRTARRDAPSFYKESPIGWVPIEWSVVSLSESARPGRAHLKTGPFGSSLKTEHWVEQGRPVITIGALAEGQFVESELLHVSEVTAKALAEYQLVPGDIVFSRVADVGRSAVITADQVGWIMSSNLMRISVDRDRLEPTFLQAQLAHDSRVRAQIRTTVNSGGRDVANGQILNRILFVRPQIEEQVRIMGRVRALDSMIDVESKRIMKLREQKKGLMHDLLTGSGSTHVVDSATT